MRRTTTVGLLITVLFCMGSVLDAKPSAAANSAADAENAALPFQWDVVAGRASTPGDSLLVREASRSKVGAATMVSYELRAPGFLPKEQPMVVVRYMDGEYAQVPAVLPDSGAKVFNPEDPTRLYPETFNVGNYVLGEAFDVAIFTADGTKHAQARVIPFPIEASGSGSCRASARAIARAGRAFVVVVEGFAPGEDVRYRTTYKGKEIDKQLTASPLGSVTEIIRFTPKERGSVLHQFVAKSGAVSLTHAVGQDAVVIQ